MDLRAYYKKIREVAETIVREFPVVVSLETADGGKAGVMTEVSRQLAARMVAENRARLANEDETKQFLAEREAAWRRVREESEPAVSKLPVAVLSDDDLAALHSARSGRNKKNS